VTTMADFALTPVDYDPFAAQDNVGLQNANRVFGKFNPDAPAETLDASIAVGATAPAAPATAAPSGYGGGGRGGGSSATLGKIAGNLMQPPQLRPAPSMQLNSKPRGGGNFAQQMRQEFDDFNQQLAALAPDQRQAQQIGQQAQQGLNNAQRGLAAARQPLPRAPAPAQLPVSRQPYAWPSQPRVPYSTQHGYATQRLPPITQ
jgi:hypothetical protein